MLNRKYLLLAISLILPYFCFAQIISLEPATLQIDQATEFSLSVGIEDGKDVFGLSFDLDFEPSLIEYLGVTEGDFLSAGCSTFMVDSLLYDGKVAFGITRLGAACGGVDGSGTVAVFDFKTLDKNGFSQISFSGNSVCVLENGTCNYQTEMSWNSAVLTIGLPLSDGASLSLSPDSGLYKTGDTFSVDILVDTNEQDVVVVAAYLNYDPNALEVVSIDVLDSIFTMEAENIIDSTNGQVKITRGLPSPGVNTANGRVARLNLRGLTDADTEISFDFISGATNESNVIIDDFLGTDILFQVNNANFTLDGTAPADVSSFFALANQNSVSLSWVNPTTDDFAGLKILRKIDVYPNNPGDGTLVYQGSGVSHTDDNLANGLTYYYTAFTYDTALNYSAGVQVSARPEDTSAPAAINDLSISSFGSNSVTLNWTAVGDDGELGTAAAYDFRYQTSLIDSSNWDSANQVSSEPIPQASGSVESMTINGLDDGVVYYFAIRVIDDANNYSDLSNIASTKIHRITDLNGDYQVNSVDFGILLSYWGSTSYPAVDVNQDGLVDSVDFGIMMSQWGSY